MTTTPAARGPGARWLIRIAELLDDIAGFMRMLSREVRHAVTLGRARQVQVALDLVPGELIVAWVGWVDVEPDRPLARRFVQRGSTRWQAGAGRATASTDLNDIASTDDDRAGDRGPTTSVPYQGPRALTWVLQCRPGTEADLADALRARAARWRRWRMPGWRHSTSVLVTRVPWLRIESTLPTDIGPATLTDSFSAAWDQIGIDRVAIGQEPVNVGVVDVAVNPEDLATMRAPNRITVETWTHDQSSPLPYRVVEDPHPAPGWHGTTITGIIATVAPRARIQVLDIREGNAPSRDVLASTWLMIALKRLPDVDLLNVSVSVDKEGLEFTRELEQLLAMDIQYGAFARRMIMVAAAGNRENAPNARSMAVPSRLPGVVAVGSLTPAGRPWPGNRSGGKDDDLLWMMPGGTREEPLGWAETPQPASQVKDRVYGTSLATALFTGYLARCLSNEPRTGLATSGHAYPEPLLRSLTLSLASRHTMAPPDGVDKAVWGRGTLRAPKPDGTLIW